jgi:predicted small lipoprotein YifL
VKPRPRSPLLLAALAALAAGCGHRGDPLPPLRKVPPPPLEFRLAQRGDALELRATAPSASVDGVAYEALTLEFLWASGRQELEKAGERRAVPALPGRRVVQTLPLPAPGTIVRAAARGVAGGRRGQRTLTETLVVQPPLDAPHDLTAVLAGDGVALAWRGARPKEPVPPPAPAPTGPSKGGATRPAAPGSGTQPAPVSPPAEEPAGAKAGGEGPAEKVPGEAMAEEGPRHSGFLVYRRLGSAAYDASLVEEPVERRSLEDSVVPQGETACYVVRAVASTGPLVESAPSNEACVEVRDVAAPATPAGLAVLPREGALEVLWAPSVEPDLAGYRVYRAGAGGEMEKVAELATTRASWLDETARPGIVYRYSVSAFDRAGNESPPAEPVEASLP